MRAALSSLCPRYECRPLRSLLLLLVTSGLLFEGRYRFQNVHHHGRMVGEAIEHFITVSIADTLNLAWLRLVRRASAQQQAKNLDVPHFRFDHCNTRTADAGLFCQKYHER